jgi:hypothetical protein
MTTDIVQQPSEQPHTSFAHAPGDDDKTQCSCKKEAATPVNEQFVYSLGKLSVKFSSLGLEKEFSQRERHLTRRSGKVTIRKGNKISETLKENLHLAKNATYIFSVGGIPAFIVIPTGTEILNSLIDSLNEGDDPEKFDLIIGKRAGIAPAQLSGGLLLPMVVCDQVYSFKISEYTKELEQLGDSLFQGGKLKKAEFGEIVKELFLRVTSSTENIGGEDSHRALNYLIVQHPGIFFSLAEKHHTNHILDSIETRVNDGANGRRVVTAIFSFIDRATSVPEKIFTRVDVTEEWPFILDTNQAASFPLMLSRYVDYGASGSAY